MKSVRTIVLLIAALALAGCSSTGDHAAATAATPWLAVARGQVDVEGGMVLVAARADGVVATVAVTQGERVKKGQALATLDPRAARIAVAAATAEIAGAQAQRDELEVARRQAGQRTPRIEAAAKAGAASGEAADAARVAVATLDAKLAAAAAALDAARQKLAAAQLGLDATTLRAPVDGTVVTRQIAIGQTVSAAATQPLFELLPERPRIVRAQLDADAADVIHAGMRAEVVRDSGEGPVYVAKVLWVGQVLQSASLTRDPLARAVANDVDCTLELVAPASGTVPLRIGQRVLVRFPRR